MRDLRFVLLIALASCGGQTATSARGAGGSGAGDAGTPASGGAGGHPGGSGGVSVGGAANAGSGGGLGGLGATGGAAGVGGGVCGAVAFELETSRSHDVVLAVDTSTTMTSRVAALESGLNSFNEQMIAGGVAPRIILLARHHGGSAPGICAGAPLGSGLCEPDAADTKLPDFFHHPTASIENDELLNVVHDKFPEYGSHLRTGAVKTLFLVSDGDAAAPPYDSADAFITAFSALDPALLAGWSLSAFYAFEPCPSARAAGTVYDDIAIRRPGFSGNLCVATLEELLPDLADSLASVTPFVCAWEMPDPPAGQQVDATKINLELEIPGQPSTAVYSVGDGSDCAGEDGWYLGGPTAALSVQLCPTTCQRIQKSGTRVTLLLGCETISRP